MKVARIFVLSALAIGWSLTSAFAGPDEAVAAYDRGEYGIAFKEFMEMAKGGNPAAQNNVAVMYANGQGTKQDLKKAAEWYLAAAEQGLPMAQYNLGHYYEEGIGIEQDYFAAAVWYRLAAMQGDTMAQYRIGVMSADGLGIDRDVIDAYMWLSLAAGRTNDVKVRQRALDKRVEVEKTMSRKQVVQAELMIGAWQPVR